MINRIINIITDTLQKEEPILIGKGTTHSIYKIGNYVCKIRTSNASNEDAVLFKTEKDCCDLLCAHQIPCVKVYGVVDGNKLNHELFCGKAVLIEEYISGDIMFNNQSLSDDDFPTLYDIINDINKIETPYFGWYPSSKENLWLNFLSKLQAQIEDYVKEYISDVLIKYQALDLNVEYQGTPRVLMLEFNPHNYIWNQNRYTAIDVNSLLCGDPLYQWARIKMHLEIHGRRHFCDERMTGASEETILKYMILSCGADLIVRKRIGLNIEKHENKLRDLICLMGANKIEK